MKKLLGIVVLGLLICSNAHAVIITYECKVQNFPNIEYTNFTLDFENKLMVHESKQGEKYHRGQHDILKVDNEKVFIKTVGTGVTWYFNYATNQKAHSSSEGWPDAHNKCKYDRNLVKKVLKTTTSSKVEMASMIDNAKDTCKSLGFKEGSDKFADCSLKLYSQSVELAAQNNQTVVMQPQSSGSNVMTIYDPVRDNQRLMDQGMKMLSGRCTLGINC